ncbi:hypothetical protein EV175_006169 [Coemansia sp. RSA 1933]|nr:hypothetical protein EV175_006169 [Coemansia sp. RSA 1933]
MGVFWPLTDIPHIARLVGLVGVVAGFCVVADRETRYALMRHLYTQLKRLDEAAAHDIEQTYDAPIADKKQQGDLVIVQSDDHVRPGNGKAKEVLGFANARDTRSFASDSTAFSRAASPHGTRTVSTTSDLDTVNHQLGEALISRLQNLDTTHISHVHTAFERMALPPTPPDTKTSYDSTPDGSNEATTSSVVLQRSSDEVLMPLTTSAGPHTPQQTPTPVPGDDAEPRTKTIDASKRLTPLPNPSAPKPQPTMHNGRPRAFDYPHPSDNAPTPARTIRRERSHVEIETTTDHDSYGFVSNPAALVASSSALTSIAASGSQAAASDHYLFVCVKCHRQSTNEVCEKICSDEDGVLRCKLRPRNGLPVDDMEDLVLPMTPRMYTNGRRKTTGRMLYENLTALHDQHERMKARTACHGSTAPHSSASRECPNAVRSRLRIVPVNCLSMCHLGNVIAVAGPGKFSYQFGAMHENDSEDMQAILQFSEDYIESDEGFTKNKTRPPTLSRNILARIPPPLPTFTSIASE